MAKKLRELLQVMVAKKASDLHISKGNPPTIRVDGDLIPLEGPALKAEEAQTLCYEILNQEHVMRLEQEDCEIDIGFAIEKLGRFRGNIFYQQHSITGAFRYIPSLIPTLKDLDLPPFLTEMTDRPYGLVLVTGTTGSGKSTTLAALLDHINQTQPWHILTVEDPIEFVFEPKKALIGQREVGRDTQSFQKALKFALREDPDVVMVGEIRDLESIAAALTLAETGHLVFTTLHTNSTAQTLQRLIDVFPSHQQEQIRLQLSMVLQGIVCQQLLPKIGGGRQLAMELLFPTPAIRNLIRENKVHQILSQMQLGRGESKMQTMNHSLAQLVKAKKVTKEAALVHSPDPEELKKLV